MGLWKNVSRPGAKRAAEAGLDVRLRASGYQVWVENADDEQAAHVEEAVSPTVQSLLQTPVSDLAEALETLNDPMQAVRAAARDSRSTARPIYRRFLGETSEEEEAEASAEELAELGLEYKG